MAEEFPGFDPDRLIAGRFDAVTHTADGAYISGELHVGEAHDGESAREDVAEMFGVDPERIAINGMGKSGIGSRSTGSSTSRTFGFADIKWRASWVPSADQDKNPEAN